MKWKICAFALFSVVPGLVLGSDVVDDVDVFIGTSGTGHTHPAASCPFGMVQAGPDTGNAGWQYCSGYQYDDTSVLGYSQTRLSGTGCPAGGDVQVLPFTGELQPLPMRRPIDKKTERASPGRYAVGQPSDGLLVEIAASPRVAVYRFVWTNAGPHRVLVNLPFGFGNGGKPGAAPAKVSCRNGREILGSYHRTGWLLDRKVSFDLVFDREWTEIVCLPTASENAAPRYLVSFGDASGTLMMKVALSCRGPEQAARNLEGEVPGWDLEAVSAASRNRWRDLLERLRIVGTIDQRRNWYTALYHLCLQPNMISDVDEAPFYSTFSCWDTYRAAHPLYTLLAPERVMPFVRSILGHDERNGFLPIWGLWGQDSQCMIGTHSVPILADAYLKGFAADDVGFWNHAFDRVKDTLTRPHDGRTKERWDLLDTYGYYPCDLQPDETVSRTLECQYDDWCAAQMAKGLGRAEEAAFFQERSSQWRKLFDPKTRFFRGRKADGTWNEPFSEFRIRRDKRYFYDYTEANAWQYRWHVQHDVPGLIAAFGGKGPFVAELERLFNLRSDVVDGLGQLDVTGLIGQYAHGNEPCHHVPYLFALAGRGDLSARYIRQIFDSQYHTGPAGLCGNDDCGQMSAWYLFSAMGFYPVNPCGGEYVLGAPQLPKVVLKVKRSGEGEQRNCSAGRSGGKDDRHCSPSTFTSFSVIAKDLSEKNKYVKSVSLNGRPLTRPILRHADILAGGTLVFEMCSWNSGDGSREE